MSFGGGHNAWGPSFDDDSENNSPNENALMYASARGPYHANFKGIRREAKISAQYYCAGCTCATVAFITLIVLMQIGFGIFMVNLYLQGATSDCDKILQADQRVRVLNAARQGTPPPQPIVSAAPWYTFMLPATIAATSSSSPSVERGFGNDAFFGESSSEQDGQFGNTGDVRIVQSPTLWTSFMSIFPVATAASVVGTDAIIGGGGSSTSVESTTMLLSPNAPPGFYRTCSLSFPIALQCSGAWSVPSRHALASGGPQERLIRSRDCDATCQSASYANAPLSETPAGIPQYVTFGYGICTCR